MQLIFKEITISNFKGIADLHIEFTENKNILEGENGIGKTSVLDAITWCLFGKNFADEKLFKITPIIDEVEQTNLITSVELKVNDTLIERIWDNSKATIKVDGVKFGIREFNDYLRDKFLITDEEFKSLSNTDYIPKLHWRDLRNLIMGLVGEITNEEVYTRGDFSLIEDKIESVGIEKTVEDIKTSKSNLSNEIKRLQGNIDQKTSDIQELVVDEEEQKQLTLRKEELKKQIDEYNTLKDKKASQNSDISKLNKLQSDLSANETEQGRLRADNVEYQKTYDSSNIDIALIKQNKIKDIENRINYVKQDIERLDFEKSTLIADREELRQKYNEEVNREIKVENSICSACGQPLPEEKIQDVLSKLKEESKSLANGYVNKAKQKLVRMEEIDLLISNYNEKINSLKKDIEQVENEQIDPNQESNIQKQMKFNMERNAERLSGLMEDAKKLEKNIVDLKEIISKHEVIEISNISSLQNELEEIVNKLAISETLNKFKAQLKCLQDDYSNLLKEKELLNEKEQQVILFNNTKAEMLKERIKHNFKLADFITQEETKDGKLVETFKIAINGIEYNALNTGHKILVALDLIDNIQRMKNKRLPILIDGLGELTRLPELDTQVIGCRAKYQANKKLEVVNQ